MASEDELLSHTTASSSGIVDSDVTILGHENIRQLVTGIERELRLKYTVAAPLCAGRTKADNIISCVRHANIKVIILTNETARRHQSFLQILEPKLLDISRTIVLYDANFLHENIDKRYKNIISIRAKKSPVQIAEQICWFIEANKEAERRSIRDYFIRRKLFIDLLIHSVLNPNKTATACEMLTGEFMKRFEDEHGTFEGLQVGKLKKHVRDSKYLTMVGGCIGQTEKGAQFASQWLHRILPYEAVRETATSPDNRCDPTSTSRQNAVERTNLWVSQSKAGDSTIVQEVNLKETEALSSQLNEFDSRYSFFLISSKLPPSNELNGIANIPWVKVIDFDINSRDDGLLSCVEKQVKSKRSFTISAGDEPSKPLSDRATDWFFPLGFSANPDTVFHGRALQWHMSNKRILEQQCSDMSDFSTCRTKPIFIILWYDSNENRDQCLDIFLSILYPSILSETLTKKVILCVERHPAPTSALHQVISKYQLEETTVALPLNAVCRWLTQAKVSLPSSSGTIKLPKVTTDGDTEIMETVEISEEVSWIQQFIEILPLDNMDEVKKRQTKDAGKDFVRGDTITWDELSTGKIAVDREAQIMMYDKLHNDIITERRTVVFKIHHTPGGGGTTFARQLLWYLHSDVPCGVVVPNPTLSITHLMERVEFLHDKTLLPIVLLVDGRSDFEVEQLYESCKYAVVILHIQRHNHDIPKTEYDHNTRTCLLPGSVKPFEADKLTELFSAFAPNSKDALIRLTKDMVTEDRFLFEYGLTAFDHEFKGVRTYVNGYMELHNRGLQLQDLLPWQSVVSYLSLVLYYSQGGLQREIFHSILKEKSDYRFVSLDDLPYSARQFIVEYNRVWKISYFVVAKEILEQVLCRSAGQEENKGRFLSSSARSSLHELVIEFILALKSATTGSCPEPLLLQLSDVILRRDYKDIDVSDIYGKRHSFSRLLEDVPDDENRIKILRTLTEAFPEHTEFHAHFGRMLNIMRRFDEAEESLQTALSKRIKESANKKQTGRDNVRGRFHHMFGFACLRRAQHEMRVNRGKRISVLTSIMPHARKAVHHFTEGRKYVTYNRSYGYIGEVRARLLIADYVHNDHRTYPSGCMGAFDGSMDSIDVKLSEFIRESHSACDQLLAECQRYTPEAELRKIVDFPKCVMKFNVCFKSVKGNLSIWENVSTNMPFRRSQIASIKMQFLQEDSQVLSVDAIQRKKELTRVINLYEKTFQETNNTKRVSISLDVLEWLEAIRHRLMEDKYSLVHVLKIVEAWNRRNELGYATYYLYVIYFVLAIYSPGYQMSIEYNRKAIELRKNLKMQQYRLTNMRFSREWLANHDDLTIRKLVCRSKLGVWDNTTRFWKDSDSARQLQVCTGTIIKSARPLAGIITMDVPQQSSRYRIEVYFVPVAYGLVGNRFADERTRVQFFVGFSAERGAEALSIKKLESKTCVNCKRITEIITLNQDGEGTCLICEEPIN